MNQKKVFFRRCSSYDKASDALFKLFSNAGFPDTGLKGKRIAVKPNLLSDKEPDRVITTHPEVVRPVLQALKSVGAVPFVADSPCSASKLEKVWEKTGMKNLCREENVELVNAEKSGSQTFNFEGVDFTIAKPFMEADAIVNIPKLKTHVLTSMTASVKNLYGTIPGYQKAQLHKRFPDVVSFSRFLAALYDKCTPIFNVLDAITGMQGDGPSAGEKYEFGFLAVSDSAVAMDFALAHLLGLPAKAVPYLPMLAKPLRPEAYLNTITFEGQITKDDRYEIRTPSTLRARLIPGWLVKLIGPLVWIRPEFHDNCIKCGKCIEACPVNALEFDQDKKVILNPKLCIGCCCCHEICPVSAVEMTQSPLLNFVRKGRMP